MLLMLTVIIRVTVKPGKKVWENLRRPLKTDTKRSIKFSEDLRLESRSNTQNYNTGMNRGVINSSGIVRTNMKYTRKTVSKSGHRSCESEALLDSVVNEIVELSDQPSSSSNIRRLIELCEVGSPKGKSSPAFNRKIDVIDHSQADSNRSCERDDVSSARERETDRLDSASPGMNQNIIETTSSIDNAPVSGRSTLFGVKLRPVGMK